MKDKIFVLVLFFVGFVFGYSQKIVSPLSIQPSSFKADTLDVSHTNLYYQLFFVNDIKNANQIKETLCVLEIGDKFSKFTEVNKIKADSLSHKFSQMSNIGADQMNLMLKIRQMWKVSMLKDIDQNYILIQDNAFKTYQYEEMHPNLIWQLGNQEGEKILGYNCKSATTEYRGRRYTAWYTTDLPLSSGPYIFQGLPGAILKIEDSKKEYKFIAVAIDLKPKAIFWRTDKSIILTSREKFRKAQKAYFDNPSFYLGNGYDVNENPIQKKIKSKPYNPLELE